MSKDKLQLLSPLFLKYQSDFEKNPRSRVFAPLAETYRKLGMTDKAMEILSQGIRFHPSYVMGYLGLAFCYFDLKQFNLAYTTLRPHIESNRDNLRLQKLFADVCLELGKDEEGLETFKYLLFINPRDKEVAEQVSRLESKIENRYKPNHKPIIIPENEISTRREIPSESPLFDVDKLGSKTKNDFDDWMTVDLNQELKSTKQVQAKSETAAEKNYDLWNVKKSDQVHKPAPEVKKESKLESNEDFRTYEVHLDLDEDQLIESEEDESEDDHRPTEAPLVTHTLVDLYCGQGHIEKALEVLEKILQLNPNDKKTIQKIKEIKALMGPLDVYDDYVSQVPEEIHAEPIPQLVELEDLEDTTEEDGRRHLMSLIDEKVGPVEIHEENQNAEAARIVEEKLMMFLKKIQKRALDYQNRV
jgi:tetratricopeptide (TPR) repeat protein